jgi:hypothetical protein
MRALTTVLAAIMFLGAVTSADARPWRHWNPPGPRGGPGTNWHNPPGPRGGPGASRYWVGWRHVAWRGRTVYWHPAYRCWFDPDGNPPGPVGGRGTNWENPPGPRGGPGASPDRNWCR